MPTDTEPRHTSGEINRHIERETKERAGEMAENPSIPQRLQELDEEWDIERFLEANAAALAFILNVSR